MPRSPIDRRKTPRKQYNHGTEAVDSILIQAIIGVLFATLFVIFIVANERSKMENNENAYESDTAAQCYQE